MNVIRPTGVGMISPGIRTGLDGVKLINDLIIRQTSSATEEIRIKRGIVLIYFMYVTASSICLPYFYQCILHWLAGLICNLTGDNDTFTNRITVNNSVFSEVMIVLANHFLP